MVVQTRVELAVLRLGVVNCSVHLLADDPFAKEVAILRPHECGAPTSVAIQTVWCIRCQRVNQGTSSQSTHLGARMKLRRSVLSLL
jgi:hypothetical protein